MGFGWKKNKPKTITTKKLKHKKTPQPRSGTRTVWAACPLISFPPPPSFSVSGQDLVFMDDAKQTLQVNLLLHSPRKSRRLGGRVTPQQLSSASRRSLLSGRAAGLYLEPAKWSTNPFSWCKQPNVKDEVMKTKPRSHESKTVASTEGLSEWRRIYGWGTSEPATRREQRAVLWLVLARALVTIFLPPFSSQWVQCFRNYSLQGFTERTQHHS